MPKVGKIDLTKIQIEKNVPIPNMRWSQRSQEFAEKFMQMEPGESFPFEVASYQMVSYYAKRHQEENPNFDFVIKRESLKYYRIWRLKIH